MTVHEVMDWLQEQVNLYQRVLDDLKHAATELALLDQKARAAAAQLLLIRPPVPVAQPPPPITAPEPPLPPAQTFRRRRRIDNLPDDVELPARRQRVNDALQRKIDAANKTEPALPPPRPTNVERASVPIRRTDLPKAEPPVPVAEPVIDAPPREAIQRVGQGRRLSLLWDDLEACLVDNGIPITRHELFVRMASRLGRKLEEFESTAISNRFRRIYKLPKYKPGLVKAGNGDLQALFVPEEIIDGQPS